MKTKNKRAPIEVILGTALGMVVGITQDNIGLWIALGLALGAAVYYNRRSDK